MTSRRPLWTIIGLLAAAAAALRAAGSLPWALLYLAAIAALFALGGWPRRVLGGLLVLLGVLNCVLAALPARDGVFALAGGVAAAVAGVLVIRHAARLPWLGTRYQAPGGGRARHDPDAELWRRLSEGDDPTESG